LEEIMKRYRETMLSVMQTLIVMALACGVYWGIAAVERYRGLTKAYLLQSEQLIEILQNQTGKK
jgi:hypothetical protein